MGKFKESFSNLYYNSQEDFFTALESGDNEPTYVGLLEIVRVLKLINGGKKKKEIPTPISPKSFDRQMCLSDVDASSSLAGAS